MSVNQSPSSRSTKARKAASQPGERTRSVANRNAKSQVVSRKPTIPRKRQAKQETQIEAVNVTPSFKKVSHLFQEEEKKPFDLDMESYDKNEQIKRLEFALDNDFTMTGQMSLPPTVFPFHRTRPSPPAF